MYYSRLYAHIFWTTQDYQKSLIGLEGKIGNFLIQLGEKKDIIIRLISVLPNHVHCIVRLNSTQSISEIVQIMKGGSSLWINSNQFLHYKFKWEDEYFAFSLGYSQISEFEKYLENQKIFHQKHSIQDELKMLTTKYNIKYQL